MHRITAGGYRSVRAASDATRLARASIHFLQRSGSAGFFVSSGAATETNRHAIRGGEEKPRPATDSIKACEYREKRCAQKRSESIAAGRRTVKPGALPAFERRHACEASRPPPRCNRGFERLQADRHRLRRGAGRIGRGAFPSELPVRMRVTTWVPRAAEREDVAARNDVSPSPARERDRHDGVPETSPSRVRRGFHPRASQDASRGPCSSPGGSASSTFDGFIIEVTRCPPSGGAESCARRRMIARALPFHGNFFFGDR